MPTFNTFAYLSEFPYNCISYLMDNSSTLWSLLKYNDSDAWKNDADHPALSKTEKGNLIYDGKKNQLDCKVFLLTGLDDAWVTESTQLRISILNVYPTNIVLSNVVVAMEVYSHTKVAQLSNYRVRQDMIIEELLRVFNGAEIGLLGRLYFDPKNVNCYVRTVGNTPFIGRVLTMANWIA